MRKTKASTSEDFLIMLMICLTTTACVGPCSYKMGKDTVYEAIQKNPEAFVATVTSLDKTTKEQEELKKLVIEMERGGK